MIPKLILHTILDIYPQINFMNNGMSIFRKLMCDVIHHESFVSISTAYNKVHKCIVYILNNIFIFFYWWYYYILCVMIRFIIPVYLHILVLYRNF